MSETDVARALQVARQRLEMVGVPDPARDASALFVALAETTVGSGDTMPTDIAEVFEQAVQRRLRREPVSHITGKRAFWMHDFIVTADVLDPRPDTETLVEQAISRPVGRVLDLGTGSGCILASILYEQPDATGIGTDVSDAALAVAERNMAVAGVAERTSLVKSDWFASVGGRFDLIVSNPPYIAADEMAGLSPEVLHEPQIALTPGGDGLDAYRTITGDALAHLSPGGRLLVEIGAGQGVAVSTLFRAAKLRNVKVFDDMNGKNRVVSGENL
ncbi:[protein release factor]-glutamine N5-methyltransferase [Jannaschia faecimaris]|uniref:Release factor glutamine methyltransferase n=1 Tax=Jannaschia faecimaris TaxID=1244108 RepID=A0A1H3QGJ5_9RHOB|nr:peptide chain release factor N(5)-glutamine methyltransferase [Jannaschia faecimaris]SDZ12714.1 [protein release factor]-glutamine N5-methyltransferase [Jannaschia faecimaris]